MKNLLHLVSYIGLVFGILWTVFDGIADRRIVRLFYSIWMMSIGGVIGLWISILILSLIHI